MTYVYACGFWKWSDTQMFVVTTNHFFSHFVISTWAFSSFTYHFRDLLWRLMELNRGSVGGCKNTKSEPEHRLPTSTKFWRRFFTWDELEMVQTGGCLPPCPWRFLQSSKRRQGQAKMLRCQERHCCSRTSAFAASGRALGLLHTIVKLRGPPCRLFQV